MESNDFVKRFQVCKENAHRFLVKNLGGYYFQRGPRVISSYFEDLLAIYIAEKIANNNNKYYVDKSFSYKINNENKTCKPDILVCDEQSRVIAYFDAKTDLGSHKSSFEKFIQDKHNFIEGIKNKQIKTKIESKTFGQKPEEITFDVEDGIKYYIIVGGYWAHGDNYQKKYEDVLKNCTNVKLNILVDWSTKKGDDFKERKNDFEEFDKFLAEIATRSNSV